MAGSIRVAGHTIAEHDIINDKVDIKNATINSSVTINAGSNVSGIGQLIGTSYQETAQTAGNQVTLESNKSYHVIHHSYHSSLVATFIEYTELSTDSSGNVTITSRIDLNINDIVLESTGANLVRIKAPSLSAFIENVAHIFEQGSTYDNA
jgi:hypothetical protein